MRPTTPPETARSEARAAGYEPDEPYPGLVTDAWAAHCIQCGAPRRITLAGVRSGKRCRHSHARLTPDTAASELARCGWEPLEPYPGATSKPWKIKCALCGRPTRKRASAAVHFVCPCKKRAERARKAEAELRAAGYEPREPYPGNSRAPWYATCRICGRPRRPSLTTIRAGIVCGHREIESRPPGVRG